MYCLPLLTALNAVKQFVIERLYEEEKKLSQR